MNRWLKFTSVVSGETSLGGSDCGSTTRTLLVTSDVVKLRKRLRILSHRLWVCLDFTSRFFTRVFFSHLGDLDFKIRNRNKLRCRLFVLRMHPSLQIFKS